MPVRTYKPALAKARYMVQNSTQVSSPPEAIAAREDFAQFRRYVCKHESYAHHYVWDKALNTGEDSKCLKGIAGTNELILAPRGSTKSTYLVEWVAFQIGKQTAPDVKLSIKILYVSYTIDVAMQKSVQIKQILESPEYQRVFPWVRPGEKWSDKQWVIDRKLAGLSTIDEPYTLACSGLKGATTSKRCLIGDTLVETEIGKIPIKDFSSYLGIKVLTFNESTKQVEWRRVRAVAERPANDIFEVRTSGGRVLRCTSDHPIYVVGQGYKQTRHLTPGDTVVIASKWQGTLQELLGMPEGDTQKEQRSYLPRVLHQNSITQVQNTLQGMSGDIFTDSSGIEAQSRDWHSRAFLFSKMLWEEQYQAQTMFKLWGSNSRDSVKQERQALCRLSIQSQESNQESAGHGLLHLPESIFSSSCQDEILFAGLCQQSSFSSHDKRREQPILNRNELQQDFPRFASSNSREGRLQMCSLQRRGKNCCQGQVVEAIESSCSPYQPRLQREQERQLSNSLPILSHQASQIGNVWQTDTISSVTELCGVKEQVYDIEVEGTHNFFANEVLVHNSHLICLDDLIKSPKQIESLAIREEMAGNWTNVVRPTMFEGGRAVCLGTRMLPTDIYETDFISRKGWQQLIQSAIVTDELKEEKSYWEEGQSLSFLQETRELDPVAFSFQYQNIVVRVSEQSIDPDWILAGEIPDIDEFDSLVMGLDLSSSLKERADYTVMILGGRLNNNFYIIDMRRMRSIGNIEKLDAIIELWRDWECPRIDIWAESVAYQGSIAGDFTSYVINDKGIYDLTCTPVPAKGDKLTRLRGVSGLFQNKLVIFNQYAMLGRLRDELINFGSIDHDDTVDSLIYCLQGLRARRRLEIA